MATDSDALAIIEQERAERTANMERLREARLKVEAAEAAEKAKADRRARDRLARQKRTAEGKLTKKAAPTPEKPPAPKKKARGRPKLEMVEPRLTPLRSRKMASEME